MSKWKGTFAMLALVAITALLLSAWSCPAQSPQEWARDSVAAAKGAIEQAQDQYMAECVAAPADKPCVAIDKAVHAQNAAIDALDLYCSGEGYREGGPCNPDKSLEPKLQEAIVQLNQIVGDVKGLIH